MKMHKCDICGRELRSKIQTHGYVLCPKHYHQFRKYGRFLDNNPRTLNDRNEYHICGDSTYIDLYDKDCNVIAQTVIDTEDLDKVKYTKWKLSSNGYAMNTPKFSSSNKHLSRTVLETDQFVDHINHDTLDNRKENLRVVNKSQNQMNANYKGVTDYNGKYNARIKINGKLIHLGSYVDEEEALYARWYAETILFKEYRYPKEEPFILESRKQDIQQYVNGKVQRL